MLRGMMKRNGGQRRSPLRKTLNRDSKVKKVSSDNINMCFGWLCVKMRAACHSYCMMHGKGTYFLHLAETFGLWIILACVWHPGSKTITYSCNRKLSVYLHKPRGILKRMDNDLHSTAIARENPIRDDDWMTPLLRSAQALQPWKQTSIQDFATNLTAAAVAVKYYSCPPIPMTFGADADQIYVTVPFCF